MLNLLVMMFQDNCDIVFLAVSGCLSQGLFIPWAFTHCQLPPGYLSLSIFYRLLFYPLCYLLNPFVMYPPPPPKQTMHPLVMYPIHYTFTKVYKTSKTFKPDPHCTIFTIVENVERIIFTSADICGPIDLVLRIIQNNTLKNVQGQQI